MNSYDSNNNNNPNVNLFLRDLHLNVLLEVINVHGGTKKPLDFIITVKGENIAPSSFAGSNNFQKVSIKPGNYDVKIANTFGYEINRISGCSGVIERTDKTCIIELIDTPKLLEIPLNQSTKNIIISFFIGHLPIFKSPTRPDNIIGELIITFLQFILILKDIRSVEVKYLNEI
jgi:hypothetical protein